MLFLPSDRCCKPSCTNRKPVLLLDFAMTAVCTMPPVGYLERSSTSVEPYRLDIGSAPSRMISPLSFANSVAKSSVLCSSES